MNESPAYQRYFMNAMLESMGVETERLALTRIREANPKRTERAVRQIYRREQAAKMKEYNKPENVSKRRISELETELAKIKDVLLRLAKDPDSVERD